MPSFLYSFSVALSAHSLLVNCAPWDLPLPPGIEQMQQDIAITETLTTTIVAPATSSSAASSSVGSATLSETSVPPTSSVVTSTSASSSSSSVLSTGGPEAILLLPPGGSPATVAGSSASSSSQLSTSTPLSTQASISTQPSSSAPALTQTSAFPPASASTPVSTSSQTSTPSQATPSASNTSGPFPTPQVMAYYPDWAMPGFPPEKIDFGRFDWIDFAFALPDQNYNLTWDEPSVAPDLLTRLVSAAHSSGKKVKLSIGGWTGSQFFSPAVSDAQSRQTLATNILAMYQQFDLDGIDIDWEYPGQDGNDGNNVDPSDSANFLAFLQLLRTTLPPTSKISAAVQTVPFADAQGMPLQDVSAFAKVLDWVLIMNYDAFGSSKTPGPNAPLSDACHNSTQPSSNAAAALDAWTSAGFPASQLVLGVPSYGYISRTDATRLRARSVSHSRPLPRSRPFSRHRDPRSRHPVRRLASESDSVFEWTASLLSAVEADAGGDADSDADADQQAGAAGAAPVLATNDDGGTDNGQVQFRGLVAQGVLQYAPQDDGANGTSGAPTRMVVQGGEIDSLYAGWSGFTRYWDECSSTPFLRSGAADQVVAYDDPLSLGMKAAFARQSGMLGVNMFDVHGDTDQWDLIDALRKGLGVS